jgi:hypothetical protein
VPDQPTSHDPRPDPTTPPARPAAEQPRSGWGLAALAILPIACCGLPLLLAAVTAASAGVVVGGMAGLILLVAAVTATALVIRRRRGCSTPAAPATQSRKGDPADVDAVRRTH